MNKTEQGKVIRQTHSFYLDVNLVNEIKNLTIRKNETLTDILESAIKDHLKQAEK